MKEIKLIIVIVIFLSFCTAVYSQDLSYEYFVELGIKYYEEGDYEESMHYFQLAQMVKPLGKEPLYYINLIKRQREGRVISGEEVESFEKSVVLKKQREKIQEIEIAQKKREKIIGEVLRLLEEEISRMEKLERKRKLSQIEEDVREEKLAEFEALKQEKQKLEIEKERKEAEIAELARPKEAMRARVEEKVERKKAVSKARVNLIAADKKESPLIMDIPLRETSIIKSQGTLNRFLAVSTDIVDIERKDESSVMIIGKKLGTTFIHLWDDAGRWTVSVKVSLPSKYVVGPGSWEDVEGFNFQYHSNWQHYYHGDSFSQMERRSLGFNQAVNVSGPTPYGDLSSSMDWARLDARQEVTGYTLGLTKGHLFGFDDFSVQGFDISESFSPLSLPRKKLYGAGFSSPAFDKKINYTLLYGKERPAYYGFISPGVSSEKDSYIEGMRMEFVANEQNSFFLNYARGYGEGREEYLKNKVLSFQNESKFDALRFSSEIAFDEYSLAAKLNSQLRLSSLNLRYSFYNVEKDFVTITGRPSNRGQIGNRLDIDWKLSDKIMVGSGLNLYKDRYNFNPDKRGAMNYDGSSFLNLQLSPTSDISNRLSYTNTPGISSPQKNWDISSTYSKRFSFDFLGKRSLSTYLGGDFRQNRNPLSPASDYDKTGILGGVSLKLTKGIDYFLRYNRYWVEDIELGENASSQAVTTGVDCQYRLSPQLLSNLRISYRNEEMAGGQHSFLAGEDSLETTLGVSYKPSSDAEIFINGMLRNVWVKDSEESEYIDASVRLGTRLSWDSFFKWAPTTVIEGSVFKDINSNGIKDENEQGISGVELNIGPRQIVSNEKGEIRTSVRLKNLIANVNFSTIPSGYILTTPSSIKVDTSHGGVKKIDFGLSAQSGIYGVVFYDANDDGKLDRDDIPLSGAVINLDNKDKTFTNSRGAYFFSDIMVGQHTLIIDVNSLPLEYLPKISIKKNIEVIEGITYSHHIPLRKRVDK